MYNNWLNSPRVNCSPVPAKHSGVCLPLSTCLPPLQPAWLPCSMWSVCFGEMGAEFLGAHCIVPVVCVPSPLGSQTRCQVWGSLCRVCHFSLAGFKQQSWMLSGARRFSFVTWAGSGGVTGKSQPRDARASIYLWTVCMHITWGCSGDNDSLLVTPHCYGHNHQQKHTAEQCWEGLFFFFWRRGKENQIPAWKM